MKNGFDSAFAFTWINGSEEVSGSNEKFKRTEMEMTVL